MKNDNSHQIQQARRHISHKAVHTDILVVPEVVEHNMRRIAESPPRRRRRINYVKKIMNDDFLMNA